MTDYQPHPAADLFPLLDDQRLAELAEDIKANGLREAITLCEGMVLDGRNRLRACERAKVEPKFTPYTGDSPVSFVWSMNGARRHLTKSQLSAVAAKMLPALKDEAAKRMGATQAKPGEKVGAKGMQHVAGPTGTARDQAGRIVGVSGETVRKAAIVKERDPALFEKVEKGEITVRQAHRQVTDPATPPRVLQTSAKRIEDIRRLASEGHRADQIADEIGVTTDYVRVLANRASITLPDKAIGKARRIDPRRVIEETVNALAGAALGLSTIDGAAFAIETTDAATWADSIGESLKPIHKLRKQLQEFANA